MWEITKCQKKAIVAFEASIAKLDIRVGRVTEVNLETRTHKPTYKMIVDFGKFGKRVSCGRFTSHPIDDVKKRLVLGVLNFEPRQMGPVISHSVHPEIGKLVRDQSVRRILPQAYG